MEPVGEPLCYSTELRPGRRPLKTLTYPSDRTVNYSYDQAGRLSSFSGNLGDGVNRNYAIGMQYDAAGSMKREQFGTTHPALSSPPLQQPAPTLRHPAGYRSESTLRQ